MNNLDKEINVEELLQANQLCTCVASVMRPVYSMDACGQVYSCAMSTVDRQQGFINGIPYCSISTFIPTINPITAETTIKGCCAIINLPPVMSKL